MPTMELLRLIQMKIFKLLVMVQDLLVVVVSIVIVEIYIEFTMEG